MRKITFFTLLLLILIAKSYGQEIDGIRFKDLEGDYISLLVSNKSEKRISFDYGNGTESYKITENGEKKDFRSAIGAVNYFCINGYEVLGVTSSIAYMNIFTIYLLKRTNNE